MLLSCNYYYLPANARSTHDLTGLHIPTWASIVNITKIPALSWHGAIIAKIHFYRFQNNRICKLYGLHRLQKKQCNINSERLVIIIISFYWTPVSSVCILLLERYSIIDELYSLFIYGCLPWIFITKTRLFKYNEKFTNQKEKKNADKKLWYFSYTCSKHRLYSLEPPRRGGSNEYPQSMF